MKSEGFEDLFVIGKDQHKLLLENLNVVITDCRAAACITEIWANDIILAFEASGYKIVKDASMPQSLIGNHLVAKKGKWISKALIMGKPYSEESSATTT